MIQLRTFILTFANLWASEQDLFKFQWPIYYLVNIQCVLQIWEYNEVRHHSSQVQLSVRVVEESDKMNLKRSSCMGKLWICCGYVLDTCLFRMKQTDFHELEECLDEDFVPKLSYEGALFSKRPSFVLFIVTDQWPTHFQELLVWNYYKILLNIFIWSCLIDWSKVIFLWWFHCFAAFIVADGIVGHTSTHFCLRKIDCKRSLLVLIFVSHLHF